MLLFVIEWWTSKCAGGGTIGIGRDMCSGFMLQQKQLKIYAPGAPNENLVTLQFFSWRHLRGGPKDSNWEREGADQESHCTYSFQYQSWIWGALCQGKNNTYR